MKYLQRILQVLACVLLGTYAALIIALDQPRVQAYLADAVEEQLETILGSEVNIDNISVGLFNAVELHGVTLYDKAHKEMLQSKLIYGKVRISSLLKGKIYLRNISVLDATFKLYKSTADGEPNFKYVIDAFKSNKKEKKPIDLAINSLLLRRCQVAYDEEYQPYPADNRFTAHHIFLHDVNANLSLKHLTDNDINLRIRQLSLAEQSGFKINNLRLHLAANREHADIHDLDITLPNTHVTQKLISMDYSFTDIKTLLNTLCLSGQFEDVKISTKDISAFVPALKSLDETIIASTNLVFGSNALALNDLHLRNAASSIDFSGNLAYQRNAQGQFAVSAENCRLNVQQRFLATIFADILHKDVPQVVQKLGDVEFTGDATYQRDNSQGGLAANAGTLKGLLTTTLGPLDADLKLANSNVSANLASNSFKPALLHDNKYIPSLADFKLTANTSITANSQMFKGTTWGLGNTDADLTVNSATIGTQTFKNIHATANYAHPSINLHVTTDDAAAKLVADLSTQLTGSNPFGSLPDALAFDVDITHLSPAQLHLTDRFGNGQFAMKATGNLSSLDFTNPIGEVSVSNFTLIGDNTSATPFTVSNFVLRTEPARNGNHVILRSDFADIDYVGPVHPDKLKEIAKNIYRNVENGVFNEAKSASTVSNDVAHNMLHPVDKTVNFIVSLRSAEIFNRLLGMKINYSGTIQAQGSATDDGNHLTVACTAPSLTFGKFSVSDISLFVRSEDGSFNVLGKGRKAVKNGDVRVELTAINREGRIFTDIEWDESARHAFFGKLSAVSKIDVPAAETATDALASVDDTPATALGTTTGKKRKFGITTDFTPSQMCIGDSMWQFAKSRVDFHNDRITIENFGIYNATQRLTINGKYDRTFEDAITVDLNNVDLDYVLAFVNLNVVEFSGHATGKIFVKALPNGDPWAKAEVNVPDLQFNHAKFGNADVMLQWDHAERDIVIEGHIVEDGIGYTNVKGYVDPVNHDLDLQTESKNTQLGFLNKYTEGIFSNISGRATGHCRIYGGFQTIEFSGHEVGEAEATIPVTGVTYKVSEADVDIIPDMFWIKSAKINDKYHGEGTASGNLMHTHIKDMRYDFVLQGSNLRLYDKPRELDMPFYATATGSGKVHLHGGPGVMNAEMQIQTSAGSELTYILDSPDADVSQLLTFHDVTPVDSDTISTLLPILPLEDEAKNLSAQAAVSNATANQLAGPNGAVPAAPTTTDINLYFEVDVEDGSCLHLITDDKSGDVITVYGSGPIQANYHNKSGFTMYGTYNISRGSYNLNIPSLAQRRKFEILDGGQVNFSGDPANADVKVKAQYVVNSASLADLNIGTGFANNTTRVNCLANIYGEVANMQFDLGLELPNCSQDEQQMVNNLIASDEDRTMQVLYLLGVGRFYAYNWNATDIAQSQSVLMMNSLLSSTLSSQLNNIISDAIGSSNWTFGTNISTGQLGWSDMEVEGLVSSRLLNNRLLLNGNFGYSERQAATTNFVGDFDMQYLITPKGTVSIKAYSETNDRYFTKSTLTTQGVGLQLKKDFTRFINLFRRRKPSNKE